MTSTIRYDFSFPPKSAGMNANAVTQNNNNPYCTNCNINTNAQQPHLHHQHPHAHQQHHQHYNNNNTSHNNNLSNKLNVNHNNNCIVIKPNMANVPSAYMNQTQTSVPNANLNSILQQQHLGGLQTPRDGNCSFTFDEFRNTFSFMDDSPLVANQNTTNVKNSTMLASIEPAIVVAVPSATDCTSTSLSSGSSTSSNTSSSASSSCTSCTTNLMTKSNSASHLEMMTHAQTGILNHHANCASKPYPKQHSNLRPAECLMANIRRSPVRTTGPKMPRVPQSNSLNSISNALIITATPANVNLLQRQQAMEHGVAANTDIENAARKYRCAAQISEATCAWKGKLPPKHYKIPVVYSTKVFVGGLPWDIMEEDIIKEFCRFGPCRVEWTNKEKFNLSSHQNNYNQQQQQQQHGPPPNQYRNHRSMSNLNQRSQNSNDPLNASKQRSSPGFVYVIYENEYSVRSLVGDCIEDYANGRDRVEFFFKISTRRVRNKEVQIIPWILADNNYALCTPKELDPKKTVFVGNLHGTMTARDLAHIMNELFGSVVYAGIDIDKLKYPIGSGRVTFAHQQNFMRAVRAAFVDIQTAKFSKRIQIDPYLEDLKCCVCYMEKGIYFCRDLKCFNYYCGACWQKEHSTDLMENHKPLMRKREDK